QRPTWSTPRPDAGFPSSPEGSAAMAHPVQFGGDMLHRQRDLRQREEGGFLEQKLMETEQELDVLLEKEKELAREREELEILNDRQSIFHDRRRELVERIEKAMIQLDGEARQHVREGLLLQRIRETSRHYLAELENLAPDKIGPVQTEAQLRRSLALLEDFENRLEAELSAVQDEIGSSAVASEGSENEDFSTYFWKGMAYFWPFLLLGGILLTLFLSLTN
ncbi:MAG: hypothetical protein AAF191_20390, partial [Verrucomicrobiota bacterium]